jgi:rSAM/selenodomain-associated transferase 2
MQSEISIVIPVLNEEEVIGQVIDHIHSSSTGHIREIIIADGGSSDRTREVAGKKGAKVVTCSKKGRASQMNEGARNASGEVLFFLHADTIPPARFDLLILNEIRRGAGSGCFRLAFDWEHPLLRFYSWFTRFGNTLIRFGDQGLFVRKELFQAVNGYDEALVVMEDQKIVRELKKKGTFSLIPQNVVTSARKYREAGVVRLQVIFFLIWAGYYLGAEQKTLVHFYRKSIPVKQI